MVSARGTRPEGYEELLQELKERVRSARLRASLSVNRELVLLYWSIGRDILDRQERLGWGAKVLDQLGGDLRKAFPEVRGLSTRNLKYMRTFAREWPEGSIGQQLAAQLPWFHTCSLLEKVKDPEQRLWYARKAIENGWSRNSVVFPDARWKFFLDASAEERARRRERDYQRMGRKKPYDEILASIRERDRIDSSRKDSPLICTEGALRVETDTLSAEGVIALLAAHVRGVNRPGFPGDSQT